MFSDDVAADIVAITVISIIVIPILAMLGMRLSILLRGHWLKPDALVFTPTSLIFVTGVCFDRKTHVHTFQDVHRLNRIEVKSMLLNPPGYKLVSMSGTEIILEEQMFTFLPWARYYRDKTVSVHKVWSWLPHVL